MKTLHRCLLSLCVPMALSSPAHARAPEVEKLVSTLTGGELVQHSVKYQAILPPDIGPKAKPFIECAVTHNLTRWMPPAIDAQLGNDPDSAQLINQFLLTEEGKHWLALHAIDYARPNPAHLSVWRDLPPEWFEQNAKSRAAGKKLEDISARFETSLLERDQSHLADMFQACMTPMQTVLQDVPEAMEMQKVIQRPVEPANQAATPKEIRRFLEGYYKALPADYLDDIWRIAHNAPVTNQPAANVRHCAVKEAWIVELTPVVQKLMPDARIVQQNADFVQTPGMQRLRWVGGLLGHMRAQPRGHAPSASAQDAYNNAFKQIDPAIWLLYHQYIQTTEAGAAYAAFSRATLFGPPVDKTSIAAALATCS